MAALPSTASLDLDLARLSLGGRGSPSPYAYSQPQPQQRHHTPGSASSSLERGALSSSAASGQPLQPHQIMQPPVHSGPPPHVQLQEPQRRRGTVKFFNSLKGFGFVVDNDPTALGGQEVFCHFSAISGKGGFRSLAEGEEVEYELVQGPKGFQAANLTGPGGRTVVGDPKARMQKPPTYPMFAPIPLPLGGPYLADPYHAQHGAVYAGSPYTSHVVYVPATASLPPSQYAYAPVPLQAAVPPPPPSASRGPQPGSSHPGAPASSAASPFAAPQYQSYGAAPNGVGLGAGAGVAAGGVGAPVPGAGADRYSSLTRIGAATGAFGAPAAGGASQIDGGRYGQQPQGGAHLHQQQQQPGFSPPGGGSNLVGLPPAGGSPPQNGSSTFGGFAPFSPPSFSHAPLFGAPPPQGLYQQLPPHQQQPHQQHQQQQQAPYASSQSPTGHQQQNGAGSSSTPSSALFGSIPAPIGSRSGTPAGGRATPALGNGSLASDAWRTAGSPASAVL
ncbi:hypothetical protein JCM6882_004625 [Rhodosporidiobolus microsporus]